MSLLGEWIFRRSYSRPLYEPVRESFLAWYREAYESEQVQQFVERPEVNLSELALTAGNMAEDPDNALVSTVEIIDEVLSYVSIIFYVASALGILDIFVTWATATFLIESPTISVLVWATGIVTSIPLIVSPILFRIFKIYLYRNAEVWKLFNNELLITRGRIRASDREPKNLFAYYLWNYTLTSPSIIPILVLLALIRWISSTTYGYITSILRRRIVEIIDEGVGPVLWEEYERAVRRELSP